MDTSFLGEEILDEDKTLRPGIGGLDPGAFNLADAVILGDIEDTAASFDSSDSGFHVKETTGARFYVSGQSQALMAPDAIPAVLADATPNVRLTPFERHVLSFIDGESPVEKIRLVAGLDETEVKTALATLADKGVVQVIGRALVDLHAPTTPAAPRKKQERRRPTGLSPLAGISDETDRAIEEAFRTQTNLAPLASIEPAGGDGGVFSDSGDEFDRATHELRSLASSATPADPRAPTKVRVTAAGASSSLNTFVPVSNTQMPNAKPNLSSDGFDAFDAPMSLVGNNGVEPPSDLSSTAGDPPPRVGPGAPPHSSELSEEAPAERLRADESIEDDSFSSFDVGTEAIARIANSEIARVSLQSEINQLPARKKERRPEDAHTRATPNPFMGSSLSRLLSDAADLSELDLEEAGGAFRSSGETPAVPRHAFVSGHSDDDQDDDYAGDEYSSADESAIGDPSGVASEEPQLDDYEDNAFDRPTDALLAEFSDSASLSSIGRQIEEESDEAERSVPGVDSARSRPAGNKRGPVKAPVVPTQRVAPVGGSSLPDVSNFPDIAAFSSEAQRTQVGQLSDDGPALSELVGGFADASILNAAVPRPPDASSVFSGHVPLAAGPDESDDYIATGPTNKADVDAARGVSDVFTRDAESDELPGPPPNHEEDDDDSDEKTNVLEGYMPEKPAGAVALDSENGPRLGEASADGETQLRHGIVPQPSRSAPEAGSDESSMEYIEEAQILGTRRITVESAAKLIPGGQRQAMLSALDSDISELSPDDDGYLGSELDSDMSSVQSSVVQSALVSSAYESEVDSSSMMSSSVVDNALPSSLMEPLDDPNATAFVAQPSSIASAVSAESGWEDEGTVNSAFGRASESTGYDDAASDASSSMLSQTPPPRRPRTSAGSEEMQQKARRLFQEALKDFKGGRVSRARMNAKLASVYDPHNEEYRAALEQWTGSVDRPVTDGKPEEVLLYEEAHRLEGSGDIDGAVDLLQQGIALNPRIAAFHNRLGVILAIRKRDFIEAARCVRRAVQLEPSNKHYKHNLGKIEKKGQAAAASR